MSDQNSADNLKQKLHALKNACASIDALLLKEKQKKERDKRAKK